MVDVITYFVKIFCGDLINEISADVSSRIKLRLVLYLIMFRINFFNGLNGYIFTKRVFRAAEG